MRAENTNDCSERKAMIIGGVRRSDAAGVEMSTRSWNSCADAARRRLPARGRASGGDCCGGEQGGEHVGKARESGSGV